MKIAYALIAVAMFGATAVVAQQDPIAARQALMKSNGKAAGALAKMVKGEAPFDLAVAKESFQHFEEAAAKMPTLFPPDSKTGGETTASPKIWENMDDFQAKRDKMLGEIEKLPQAAGDLDSLKAQVGATGKACKACHDKYREK
jgi:cytochrome c556